MSEKNTAVPNISNGASPISEPVDVIWATADFQHENVLPVIGSCQVSSILSTLDQHVPPDNSRPEVQTNANDSFKSIPINIINSDSVPSADEVKKRKKNSKENVVILEKKLFQEMVYFGCNLCPFICTKDSKISDHIKSVHNSINEQKRAQLKCPGCSNIFYHKLSLRSHLIHDHEVGRSDINKIVNSIVYVSVLAGNNNETELLASFEDEEIDKKNEDINFLDEMEHEDSEDPEQINYLEHEEFEKPIQEIETAELQINEEYSPKEEHFDIPDVKQPIIRRRSSEELKRTQKCCISTCAVRMHNVVNMAYHVKCHFGKVFRCLECNENFVIWKTLQTHLWRLHSIDMELYSCDKCDYKTYSLAKLNNIHKLIHGEEKPFLCDLCGKGFKNPKQLRNHKIIHKTKTVEKMQECTVCDRTFADKRLLKVHISGVHQKLKPFCCSYCGYKASSNGALKLHIRQHTGEKPFSCDSCDYTTADHNSLRRHRSRHSGEKKYKCKHCDYACIQSSTYKTHLKTKHPGLENEHMFSCNQCQFRSVNSDKFKIHIASHKETKKNINLLNIYEQTEGLEERVVEIVSLNKKPNEVDFVQLHSLKPQLQDEYQLTDQDNYSSRPKKPLDGENSDNTEIRLQETPVALISKINDANQNNHCIILPVQNESILNLTNSNNDNTVLSTTSISTNSIQYYYSGPNVLLEIIDDKNK